MKNKILLLILISFSQYMNSQRLEVPYPVYENSPNWVKEMYSETPNLLKVKKLYTEYFKTNKFVKGPYTQFYKRWIKEYEPYINAQGEIDLPSKENLEKQKEAYRKQLINKKAVSFKESGKNTMSDTWSEIGPWAYDHEAAVHIRTQSPGSAHVYMVRQSLTNPNTVYASTATAGVWKSIDKGLNWNSITKDLLVTISKVVEVDPTNENIVYFGTGSAIYKSINGGTSWTQALSGTGYVNDIKVKPDDASVVIVATRTGLYGSRNGGENWTRLVSEAFFEIEFHSSNNQIVYAVSNVANRSYFYKSTDGGASFSRRTNGWPGSNSEFPSGSDQKRTEISVSPADPNLVVALASGAVGHTKGGLVGIYKSIDAGETFTFECCGTGPGGTASSSNKNILGYNRDFITNGGQYYWDLALDVSPIDSDKIFSGGIMLGISNDGGKNWVSNAGWTTGGSETDRKRYIHADIHDIKMYKNGASTDLWVSSDGGVYYSSNQGQTMEPRSFGIQGTEFWGFGSSEIGDSMIGGVYHNGRLQHYNNVYLGGKYGKGGWIARGSGDGNGGFIHDADPQWFLSNDGLSVFPDDRLVSEKELPYDQEKISHWRADYYGNIEWTPHQYNEFYVPINEKLWRTNDNGSAWELVHDFTIGTVYNIRISKANAKVVYLAHKTNGKNYIRKSINGGTTWTDITPPDITVGGSNYNRNRIKAFDVSDLNENHLWLAVRGSQNAPKIFKSINGGSTWTDITGNLLNSQPVYSISHQQGTDGGIYVGTIRAVYYKNNTMTDFVLYNDGLPAATFARWQYPNYTFQKLRIGTKRGAFEGDFYEPSKPIAHPSVNLKESRCVRDTLYFKDLSYVADVGFSREWRFPGGSPESSTERDPKVIYNEAGTYSATLTVTDVHGTSTKTLTDFIKVTNGACEADSFSGKALQSVRQGGIRAAAFTSGPIKINPDEFSVSCWVKTNSTASSAAILANRHVTFREKGWVLGIKSGKISFKISHNSDLHITTNDTYNDNKWHYIVATFTKDNLAKLYVDGVFKSSASTVGVSDFSNNNILSIGGDNGARDVLDGLIDEVKIWDKAISQNYLREQRHLTAKPTTDANLTAYYQFNNGQTIYDKAGYAHAKYVNSAINVESTAPIGGGTSDRLTVTSGGKYNFTNTDLDVTFSSSGTTPNGEVVASKIKTSPNQNPTEGLSDEAVPFNYYWVINNYGENKTFSSIEKLTVINIDNVLDTDLANPSRYSLYFREDNADGVWGESIDKADNVATTPNGIVEFSNGLNLSTSGQLIIAHDPTVDETLSLPSDNFNIGVVGETCPDKNNGKLTITAKETYKYTATINGADHNFDVNGLTLSDLNPGVYDICIEVDNKDYKQCYTITIGESNNVSGKISNTKSGKAVSVNINKGTAPYQVLVNGESKLNTSSSSFILEANHGDLIEVKSAKDCEGVISKKIDLFENTALFPNPTKGLFEIEFPVSLDDLKIEIYTSTAQRISSKTYEVKNRKVRLDIEHLPVAIYFVKVYLEGTPVMFKILKK